MPWPHPLLIIMPQDQQPRDFKSPRQVRIPSCSLLPLSPLIQRQGEGSRATPAHFNQSALFGGWWQQRDSPSLPVSSPLCPPQGVPIILRAGAVASLLPPSLSGAEPGPCATRLVQKQLWNLFSPRGQWGEGEHFYLLLGFKSPHCSSCCAVCQPLCKGKGGRPGTGPGTATPVMLVVVSAPPGCTTKSWICFWLP